MQKKKKGGMRQSGNRGKWLLGRGGENYTKPH